MSANRSTPSPQTILVTGSNGALGRKIVEDLAADGRRMRAAARGTIEGLPAGASGYLIPSVSGDTDWSEAVGGADAVVHCAALTYVPDLSRDEAMIAFREVNVEGTLTLARQAAAAGVKRFVFISSATVNGRTSGKRKFRASDTPNPQTGYSRTKLEAEEGLKSLARETGLEVAIIRPPRILWPEITGNLALLQRLVQKGIPMPFGLVTHNRRDNVSPESLVTLITACLDRPAAAGRTFLVSDGDPLSTKELLIRIGLKVGRKPRLLPVPPGLLRLIVAAMPGALLGKMNREEMLDELLGNLELDISDTCSTLGWQPSPSTL